MTVEKHSWTICGCSAAATAINIHEATAERMCFNYSLTRRAMDHYCPVTDCREKSRDRFAVNRHALLNPEHTRYFSTQNTFTSVRILFMDSINEVRLLSFRS